MTIEELKVLQSLPLDIKIMKTKLRIRDAVDRFGEEGLYISFSGGKDSTVLMDIVKQDFKNIPVVFCDTGLEYPELKAFAVEKSDVVIRPSMSFIEVLKKYGYPMISKEQSQFIHQYKHAKSENTKRIRMEGNKYGMGKISEKWKYLIDADFDISDKCCDKMKKEPFKKYEKETGRVPILGKMACESMKRKQDYIAQGGCNAFENKRAKSEPIGFWMEQDILKYIRENDVKIASVYGEIVPTDNIENGQLNFWGVNETELKTTGCNRTGCIFCGFGCHMENEEENRFIRLRKTHPKIYEYCMSGGEFGEDGKWKPKNGLGMDRVLEEMGIKH